MKKLLLTKFKLRPRILMLAFGVMAVLMVLSALIELHQSKQELMTLMTRQSHHVLETVLTASRNALMSNEYLERAIRQRLLNNAHFVKLMYEAGTISDRRLERLVVENDVYRINIFDRSGKKIYSGHEQIHADLPEKISPREILAPIFNGEKDTLFIGLKPARYEEGFRYAVALAAKNRSAIVVSLDAEKLLEFRQTTGFGSLMRTLAQNPGIVYVALQDTQGILAASMNVTELEGLRESPFLWNSWQDSTFATRIIEFNSEKVFEAVHPFYFQNRWLGVFRLGLSLEALNAIEARLYRRLVVISLVLTLFGFILFALVLFRQHLDTVQKQYQVLETYSGNIIENVSDAVVVSDETSRITLFNHAAERLFQVKRQEVLEKSLTVLFDQSVCETLIRSVKSMEQIECIIKNTQKYLLISRGEFRDETDKINQILVIRDLTELKRFEAQLQRRERLSAMGELASGIAHEIRNPLNTISTIVQQLDRDFEPQQAQEEYHSLMRLVYQEVKRINETITAFLRFSRPEPLQPERFPLKQFLEEIHQHYQYLMEERQIDFRVNRNWDGEVYWDRRKMKQVFMNLIQNAVDALGNSGEIEVSVHPSSKEELEIRIHDSGPGIPEDIRSKVFNLYFTTKAKGTGIGLAIVQRLVYDHGGMISVESEPSKGTTFIIRMPVEITQN
ncbi:MAG: hypothetical protein Kow0042_01560 [Calditrichia bacterium]